MKLSRNDSKPGTVYLVGAGPGHGSSESLPVPWREIGALPGGTVVVYMGLANLDAVVEQLTGGGTAPDTSCMVIQGAATGLQRVLETNLRNVVRECERLRLRPPALVVIGEVIRYRNAAVRGQSGVGPMQTECVLFVRA